MPAGLIEQNRRGRVLVDFGAFPGVVHTSATIGINGVTSDDDVRCWILPIATADHTADEAAVEDIEVRATPSTDLLTIHAFSNTPFRLYGTYYVAWSF